MPGKARPPVAGRDHSDEIDIDQRLGRLPGEEVALTRNPSIVWTTSSTPPVQRTRISWTLSPGGALRHQETKPNDG